MNELENRLRAAFRGDAETVRPESIRHLGDRPERRSRPMLRFGQAEVKPHRKVLIPLAAAASVAMIAIAATVVVPGLSSSHRSGGPTAHRGQAAHGGPATGGPTVHGSLAAAYSGGRVPTGPPPRFFLGIVQINRPGTDYATVLNIYSSATGRVVNQIGAGPGRYYQAVAALGGDQEFVAAATPGSFPRTARGCDTWLTYFRLNAKGQVNDVTVPGTRVPGFIGNTSLAASANGKVISYATSNCGTETGQLTVAPSAGTGRTSTSTWTWTFPNTPHSLSLSADGSLAAFEANSDYIIPTGDGGYVLRTNSAPGPLTQHWRKLLSARAGVDSVALSPTGAVTFAAVSSVRPSHVTVSAYNTSTGQPIRTIRVFTKIQVAPTEISADKAGHFAIVYMTTLRGVQLLNLTTGQVRTLPVSRSDFPVDIAW
jgi:hypothetical protein